MGLRSTKSNCGKPLNVTRSSEAPVCGICGKLNFDREARVTPELLKKMADAIEHRGPDDEGFYTSGPVGFGFRRLSIIDLNTGHQPLSNEDGTVWIEFNGEIYNYQELREQLVARGHVFRTKTDTEVIVHLYEEFGPGCVDRLRGMFAFAIWDERKQLLLLARDRVGIKPLYYWKGPNALIFGSEIKAILADPECSPDVDPRMIDRFLSFYYVPGEETLHKDLYKLAPGSYMVVQNGNVKITQYWDLVFSPKEISLARAKEQLLSLLEECVRMHMIADVPVGFLLSGGLDSTAMLGFAAGKTDHKLSSFTLGFSEPGIIDERPYAQLAAKTYGAEHREMTISAKDFADFLPNFAWYMEEPVCEPQAVALYYVSRLAKAHVKVLISGEGGDEAFAGYPNYRNLLWLERAKNILGPLKGLASMGLAGLNAVIGSDRIAKYQQLMPIAFEDYYFSRISHPKAYFTRMAKELYTPDYWEHVNKPFSFEAVKRYLRRSAGQGFVNQMLYVDTKTSLPDDLLLKADKMTMANSLELRVPLLDHKMLEFAASLPESLKVHGTKSKYIAKEALAERVPQEILHRKKAGFPVPYAAWLRTELKDWVRGVILDPQAISRGYFQRSSIEKLIQDDAQFQNRPKEILSLVSLELWHRAFTKKEKKPVGNPVLVH
jgi:asparagine synthase (glutamine-hydrolysing)